ncbi:PPE domain-containing protein [Actinophytocola sp.]|uniref:PPE domain-containing protein n=1 Tax=Actinophytocola sp. TaxID=1872138 RepID=UPI002ED98C03
MTQPTEQPGSRPSGQPVEAARWRGHTHKELYLLLHDGPGAAASAEPSRRWAELSTTLTEIGQDLQKALEQAGASWAGRAAGAAYDRLSTTATWATETSADAAGMRTAVENQAEHIARARADMPAPEDVPPAQPDPTIAPAVQVAAAQTDLEGAEATASSAEERAFEVMAAYELNTNTTTDALAVFGAPPELIHRDEIHQGQGIGNQHTHASSAITDWRPQQQETPRSWPGESHGNHGGGRGGWGGGWGTGGASAPWTEPEVGRRPSAPSAPAPAPGRFSGAAPLFASTGDRSQQRSSNRSSGGSSSSTGGGSSAGGNSGAPGGGSSSGASPRTGATSMGVPAGDLQAAAASQAAVHQAGAPMAPAAGAPVGGGQDRLALRRFGMDAIGSNQWFGEVDEPVVGQAPKRRRDFREVEQVTESVSILGEEHKLPPNVIGDGPTR